jgi:hypothetical protein
MNSTTKLEVTHLQRGKRIALFEVELMPVGIDRRGGTSGIEPGDLFSCQVPTNRTDILTQLFFVTRTKKK